MSSYNYNDTIDIEPGSFQDKFLDYANNWEDDESHEKKRVKIILAPLKDELLSFEDKINSYIEKESNNIKIFDIKYLKSSIMIIYEPYSKNNR